jgi:REP element-mobilizing transposase RayT
MRIHRLRALLREADRSLDQGLGHCYMRDHRVAKIVAEALKHFDDQRYRLLCWCVMPNHVHALLRPAEENKLESILHSWKSYSALQANRLLKRTGEFWQRDYFDHLVRNEASLQKISRYIVQNPEKAGLTNWPWGRNNAIVFCHSADTRRPREFCRNAGILPAKSLS